MIAATGLHVPYIPAKLRGVELTEGYDEMDITPEKFAGQVLGSAASSVYIAVAGWCVQILSHPAGLAVGADTRQWQRCVRDCGQSH